MPSCLRCPPGGNSVADDTMDDTSDDSNYGDESMVATAQSSLSSPHTNSVVSPQHLVPSVANSRRDDPAVRSPSSTTMTTRRSSVTYSGWTVSDLKSRLSLCCLLYSYCYGQIKLV